MEDAKATYSAVYHFRDEHLIEKFMGKIPHSQLVDYLRRDESLRNRCFRGFRISNTAPGLQRVATVSAVLTVGSSPGGERAACGNISL
jgi:hypothetical protein